VRSALGGAPQARPTASAAAAPRRQRPFMPSPDRAAGGPRPARPAPDGRTAGGLARRRTAGARRRRAPRWELGIPPARLGVAVVVSGVHEVAVDVGDRDPVRQLGSQAAQNRSSGRHLVGIAAQHRDLGRGEPRAHRGGEGPDLIEAREGDAHAGHRRVGQRPLRRRLGKRQPPASSALTSRWRLPALVLKAMVPIPAAPPARGSHRGRGRTRSRT